MMFLTAATLPETTNTVASHGETITLLSGKKRIDYEAELAVVIGKRCRSVSADNAEAVVAGYTCLNDFSNRDDQTDESNWIRAKEFDSSAAVGPVIASPDELLHDAHVCCRVNGDVRQRSSIEYLTFPVKSLIEEITSYMTLGPVDIISTGTPDGIGALSNGDTVEVGIDGVGTLRNEVRTPNE